MSWLKTVWRRHRTKTLGFLAMIIGAAQVNFDYIRDLIPAKWHGILLFSFGVCTAIIGFVNSHQEANGSKV